jgi:hypothetical protein
MSDEEMQKLQEQIVQGIQEYFENYNWDKALEKLLEDK